MTALELNVDRAMSNFLQGHGAGAVVPRLVRPGQPVRVALVAADAHVRQVIAQELSADSRTELVAHASTVRGGRGLLGGAFDVLLVDLGLPDGNGLELVADLKAGSSNAVAVVMSTADDDAQALQALCMGAAGWVVRTAWLCSFSQVVLQVASGGAAMTHSLARQLLHSLQAPRTAARIETIQGRDGLTGRETQVLRMVAGGLSSRAISEQLAISADTVNAHVKSIYRKLGVHNRAQVVRAATRLGLLE
jgi:DNA-binding NarL/FixJ family response regulator